MNSSILPADIRQIGCAYMYVTFHCNCLRDYGWMVCASSKFHRRRGDIKARGNNKISSVTWASDSLSSPWIRILAEVIGVCSYKIIRCAIILSIAVRIITCAGSRACALYVTRTQSRLYSHIYKEFAIAVLWNLQSSAFYILCATLKFHSICGLYKVAGINLKYPADIKVRVYCLLKNRAESLPPFWFPSAKCVPHNGTIFRYFAGDDLQFLRFLILVYTRASQKWSASVS